MKLSAEIIRKYLKTCENQKNLDAKTVKAYRIDLRQFAEFSAGPAAGFDRETIKAYVSCMNEGYQPSTVRRKIASLRAFGAFLEEEGLLPQNPFTGLRLKVKAPSLLPKVIPLRVVEDMLEAAHKKQARGDHPAVREAAVMELLFATGIRVSELCRLKTRDLDLVDGVLRIYGKGAKERVIQLTNTEVLGTLRRYAETYQPERGGFFFRNRRGGRLSEQSVRLMLRKYAKLIGSPTRITPHMFRHTLATLLLEADVDIRYIQQLLGHSSILTTQIYTHVAGAKQRDILARKHPRNRFSFHTAEKTCSSENYT